MEEEVLPETRDRARESPISEPVNVAPELTAPPVYEEEVMVGKMALEPVAEEDVVSVEMTEQHFTPRASPTAGEQEGETASRLELFERRGTESSPQMRAHSEALIGLDDLEPSLKRMIKDSDYCVRQLMQELKSLRVALDYKVQEAETRASERL